VAYITLDTLYAVFSIYNAIDAADVPGIHT